ncbi:Saposin B [Macleaya cordata]|uniref:Saposin B n=1 Tax=Macleaya cordata TaxID=56857 RepID=A0A200QMS6_MACCD|nr:Saposin B [Macleaya cordata]
MGRTSSADALNVNTCSLAFHWLRAWDPPQSLFQANRKPQRTLSAEYIIRPQLKLESKLAVFATHSAHNSRERKKRVAGFYRSLMEKIKSVFVLLLSALLISSWVPISYSAKKPVFIARKEDIPYIKCQVCEKLATQLYQQVNKKQSQISPKKVTEFQIIEIAENVCNLKKEEADWILRIDIVEKGDKLELVEHDTEGQCNSECKTIERACQEVMDFSDTDVAEYMYKSKPQIDSLVNYLCNDLTKACSVKPPLLPKDRAPGEPFIPKSSKEAEMEKILRSMQGMPGAPGMKMYSKDDLLNNNFGDEDADEDDEDEDSEQNFPSKLGKVLREKETATEDWVKKITKRVSDTGAALKRHANKVSGRIQQWWRKRKTTSSKKSSKGSKTDL